MKIFKSKLSLKKEIFGEKNISFVPTMGGLHKGHISLIKRSKKIKGKILVSIFINPKQFNDKIDFLKYPKNLREDLMILKRLKVDYVYLPTKHDIFNFNPKNKIFLDRFSKKLCGKTRKKHFKGVLNVVNRFLEIIKPHYLLLGLKDFQQLLLIKKHIIKRKINTKVISCNTLREENGIACSTRNKNLSKKQVKIASNVYLYLKNIKKSKKILRINLKKKLLLLGVNKIDYVEILNLRSLKKPKIINKNCRIFIAYYLKKIRLIDNI